MIRPILTYGAPELRKKSEPVETIDEELRQLAADLIETMYAAPGIGLAAPQVGVNVRLIVVDVTAGAEDGQRYVLVNPEIHDAEGSQREEEGCLSIPGITASVERPLRVRVSGLDLEGAGVEFVAEGLLARAFCHEVDHLDGVLYIDRLPLIKRDLIKRRIRRLIRAGEWD